MISGMDLLLLGLAGLAAGLVNALAGGGTLITFPALTAAGLAAVAANVTSTVALAPGYLGATLAQAEDLAGQARRLRIAVPAGIVGGLAGAWLLLSTSEKLFRELVPFLILAACVLLALQDRVRSWLTKRGGGAANGAAPLWIAPAVGLAAIYGGYFGAGVSVILLAVIGLAWEDSLTRLNALKQATAFGANVAAATVFVFSGRVEWRSAVVVAIGAMLGGALGGRLARRVPASALRWTVVGIGAAVAVVYWVR
jgi:uncharacterized membrane protein YfcA